MSWTPWAMDIPLRATLPLFAVGGLTLVLSLLFCCYLWRLRRQGEEELGYRELPQETIVIKFKRQKNSSNEVCPVCLDDFKQSEKVAVCPCAHVFHCKCLQQWLQQRNVCPLCKQRVRYEPGENTRLVHSSDPSEV